MLLRREPRPNRDEESHFKVVEMEARHRFSPELDFGDLVFKINTKREIRNRFIEEPYHFGQLQSDQPLIPPPLETALIPS